MVTNDERRDVARRLRGVPVLTLAGFNDDGIRREWEMVPLKKLSDAMGTEYDGINDTEGHLNVLSRLADLIDPVQGGTCAECAEFDRASKTTPCRAFHGHTEADVTACDDFKPMKFNRDALLKLADELDMCSVDRLNHLGEADGLTGREYARRIREALGVDDA